MTTKEVDKSIRQMRQMFAFVGLASILGAANCLCLTVGPSSQSGSGGLIALLVMSGVLGVAAFCFFKAFVDLGRRRPSGHTFARISSLLCLFYFPLLTIFGISYLKKLATPEMKQALSVA